MSRNKLTGLETHNLRESVRKQYAILHKVNQEFYEKFFDEEYSVQEVNEKKDSTAEFIANTLIQYVLKNELIDESEINMTQLKNEIANIPYLKDIIRLANTQLGKLLYNMLFPAILRLIRGGFSHESS